MGILSRFSDIMSSNINSLLDKMEDPSKMVDQYLRNAMEDLAECKKETAGVIAEERRCKRLVYEIDSQVTKFDNIARAALRAGNEDDARMALAKKQELQGELASRNTVYQAAKVNADKMRQLYAKLKSDVESLKSRRNRIKAAAAVAKTQETVNKITGSARGQAGAKIDALEEKVNARLDTAEAAASLDAEPDDPTDGLLEKYGSGGGDVDAALAPLKAEMGIQ